MTDVRGLVKRLKGPHYCADCCDGIRKIRGDIEFPPGLHTQAATALTALQSQLSEREAELARFREQLRKLCVAHEEVCPSKAECAVLKESRAALAKGSEP